jgi:hypothetical protein
MYFTKSIATLAVALAMLACTADPSTNPDQITETPETVHTAPTGSVSETDASATTTDSGSETGAPQAALSDQDRITAMQQRLRDQQAQAAGTGDETSTSSPSTDPSGSGRYRLNVAPYNQFADTNGFLNFTGTSLSAVQEQLGDAPVVVRMSRPGAPLRREVRVYFPFEEDPTGLYLFFRNEVVVSFKMDEFSGLQNPAIAEFFGY